MTTVTFASGFLLGLSIISISILHVGEDLGFTGVWLVISYFLARKILGFDSVTKTLGFLGFDTVLDYGLGGFIAVPAGLTLLSVVPVSTSPTVTHAVAAPFSLRPLIIIVGVVLVLIIVAIRKKKAKTQTSSWKRTKPLSFPAELSSLRVNFLLMNLSFFFGILEYRFSSDHQVNPEYHRYEADDQRQIERQNQRRWLFHIA